ncbi:MAG TPA: phosphoribosylglycinamide formyltransferase [Actinomycetota bacterium]|nr:phosphoribosylglycinamide formyltransferase [Actinomycetota bacterium]
MGGRIVVLISGSGSNMEAICDACEDGHIPASVTAVLADRDCLGLQAAGKRDIPTEVVEPGDYEDRDSWSHALLERVESYAPDLVVSAGFMRILSPEFVAAFQGRLINLHPSLLPAFPGAHGVREALEHGVKVAGSTVHFVDDQVDHGPIIMQEAVRVEQNDTETTLHERIKNVEHRLLPRACALFLEGKIRIEDGRVMVDQT